MFLSNLLDSRAIIHERRILSKEQVYRLLVEKICKHHRLPICGEALTQLILERDQISSTAYASGISIPHIRMENFQDTVIGMAFLQNPLDYDGIKVHWVCLVISDKSSSKLYLNLVAALLKLSKDQDLVSRFKNSDASTVIHEINKLQIRLKQEVTIADIMVTDVVSISPDALLSELSDKFCHRNLSYIPVTDENGRYLGNVNILRLLKVGVPDYLMMLDNISFLRSYEPLEKLFEQEDVLTVGEIMDKEEEYLTPETSIPEAVFEMIQHHKRFFSVVNKDGMLVGVVTAMDIFRKVIKA